MTICAIVLAATLPVFDFATNSINQRIAGADPAVCLARFADYPPSKGKLSFPRCLFEKPFPVNEKFWLKDVDFSCASPWNDSFGVQRAGTLISKRHVVFSKHFPLSRDCRILFVDGEGNVCPCNVDQVKLIEKTDIGIGLLNAEVTPNIKPAKILPVDYEKWIDDLRGLPVVSFNQHEEVVLSEISELPSPEAGSARMRCCYPGATRKGFARGLVSGDSGNPAFILIGKDPILIYCVFGPGAGSGYALHFYRDAIQKAMDELCPGCKLEEFDFKTVTCRMGG